MGSRLIPLHMALVAAGALLWGACSTQVPAADGGTFKDQATDGAVSDSGQDALPVWPPPLPATLSVDGQLLVAGSLGGTATLLALDTGAYPTAVDRRFAPPGPLAFVDLQLGPITRNKLLVAVVDLRLASSYIGAEIGGLVGSDVLGSWYVGLDYRTPAAYLLAKPPLSPAPGSTGAPAAVPFTPVLGVPVVSVSLEHGTNKIPVKLIADTGSGVTLLTQSIFDTLDPTGVLPRLEGYTWHTNSGSTAGFVTRIPKIKAGQAEVEGSWAVVIPDEHHLSGPLQLGGLPSGFLGFPFYRAFLTLYAGPDKRYLFYPAPTWPTRSAEWRRVGVEIAGAGAGVKVVMVYRSSSADKKGVQVGDHLLAVDGQPPSGRMTLAQALGRLRGTPAQRRKLTLLRGARQFSVEVEVEDLLPLLP
jgi:hypothetical protein